MVQAAVETAALVLVDVNPKFKGMLTGSGQTWFQRSGGALESPCSRHPVCCLRQARAVAVVSVNAIPVFYCDEMIVESGTRSRSSEKAKDVVAAWQMAGFPIELRPVVPASIGDLCLAHDPTFVNGVLAGKINNGFHNRRLDIAKTLPLTSGAMLGACSSALEYGIACAPVSGFHHAGFANARAFCTFNGLMVAALKLILDHRVRRVMILDCDQHLGDGTDDIIHHLKIANVENVSFGRWFMTNVQADRYLEMLDRQARRFPEFDLIIYQAGADAHVDDPLGGVLTTEQMSERDRVVFTAAKSSGVPLAWNLAGGYREPFSRVVALHVDTMRECVAAYRTL